MKRLALWLVMGALVFGACGRPTPAPSQPPLPTDTPYPTHTLVPAALPTVAEEPPATPTVPAATPTAPRATWTPAPVSTLPADCPTMPEGGLNNVWRNEQVYPHLGCAVAPEEWVHGTETYLCDGMHLLWLKEKHLFVAIPAWWYYPDPWLFVADESGLPDNLPLMPEFAPRGQPCFPIGGRFSWLVRALHPDQMDQFWGRSAETPFFGVLQQFVGGWLFWNGNVCFVLFGDGTWLMF